MRNLKLTLKAIEEKLGFRKKKSVVFILQHRKEGDYQQATKLLVEDYTRVKGHPPEEIIKAISYANKSKDYWKEEE